MHTIYSARLTGIATARAVESSETIKTVVFSATKESQKESGFFDVAIAASSPDPDITGSFLRLSIMSS